MAVDVEGDPDVAVTEALAYDLGWTPACRASARVCRRSWKRMTERPASRTAHGEELRQPLRMRGSAILPSEDEVLILVGGPESQFLPGPPGAVRP